MESDCKIECRLNEDGSKYWARTNDAYHRHFIERKALANEIRNVVKVMMPLCLVRVEDVFALFFKSAVGFVLTTSKVYGLSILHSFLGLFKDGRKRLLCPKSFFVEGKAGTWKVCVLCS